MNDAEKINVLRAAFIAMLPQLRLADLHLGLMNHLSLENKARIALERSDSAREYEPTPMEPWQAGLL